MTIIKNGFHVELVNRNTQRVIFSAATDEIAKPVFDQLWQSIGDQIFDVASDEKTDNRSVGYYEIRLTPLRVTK